MVKKSQSLVDLKSTIMLGLNNHIQEVDEIFTFFLTKINHIRIWIAQCRQTRQIVSFYLGDGSMESCKRMWRKLPYEYLKCNSFSDFWKSYNCLPTATHKKVGKETGETAHIERLIIQLDSDLAGWFGKVCLFQKKNTS